MTAKEFVLDYVLNHPDNIDIVVSIGESYFSNLEEFFRDRGCDYVWSEKTGSGGRWDDLFVVQEINGKLIGYEWASTAADVSIWAAGWEFDEDSICFVEEYTVTVTKYQKI